MKRRNSEKAPETRSSAPGCAEEAVRRCLKIWKDHRIPVYSLVLLRHGRTELELYSPPFERTSLHRFYSVTKSLTSLAVGCLADEGRLKLDDGICGYFPEWVPEPVPEWLAKTTIRDMLRMESCHSKTTYKLDMKENWTASFFRVPPDHRPGTLFCYDTSATHTLCALVEKLTGRPLLSYLREKFLDELGFSPGTYCLTDPFGTTIAGGGLMARPEDMAKLGQLLLQRGSWNGRQLLPEWYLKEALTKQVSTAGRAENRFQSRGYGYQFWMLPDGAFAAWGKAGQLMAVFPREEAVLIMNADTGYVKAGDQVLIETACRELIPEGTRDGKVVCRGDFLPLRPVLKEIEGMPDSPIRAEVNRARFVFPGEGWLASSVLAFDEAGDGGEWHFNDREGKCRRIRFGITSVHTERAEWNSELYGASAAWTDERTFFMEIRLLELEVSTIRVHLVFSVDDFGIVDGCTVWMENTTETPVIDFSGCFSGTREKVRQ